MSGGPLIETAVPFLGRMKQTTSCRVKGTAVSIRILVAFELWLSNLCRLDAPPGAAKGSKLANTSSDIGSPRVGVWAGCGAIICCCAEVGDVTAAVLPPISCQDSDGKGRIRWLERAVWLACKIVPNVELNLYLYLFLTLHYIFKDAKVEDFGYEITICLNMDLH